MKWGNNETNLMTLSHLNNSINWVFKEWKKELILFKSPKDQDLINNFRQSQINCLRAEIDYRGFGLDNRLSVEILHETIEKKNKLNSLVDELLHRSNLKFSDTFGFEP